MRLRYESLVRTQEKLVKEMELAIDKRESISLRFHSKRVQESESDSATPMTQIGLKKQILTLKKALSAATVDTQGYEEAMEVRRVVTLCGSTAWRGGIEFPVMYADCVCHISMALPAQAEGAVLSGN